MTARFLQHLAPNKSELALGVGITIAILLMTVFFQDALDGLEKSALYAEYRFRGESKVDSSIIIAYLDDDDIQALGGWPLKRSYYALVVSVLADLGVKVIGIDDDYSFGEPNQEYPEYDEVLSTVVRDAGNVILSGYFKSLGRADTSRTREFMEKFAYPVSFGTQFPLGGRLVSPFPQLLDAARGLGHTNFTDDFKVPLFVSAGKGLIPSFSFEVLRINLNVEKNLMVFSSNAVTIAARSSAFAANTMLEIPLDEDGMFRVNFVGGARSLNLVPLVKLLRAYDDVKFRRPPTFPLEFLRGKMVIVGIIASGPSAIVQTPFVQQFPVIGIHAMVLDNILHQNFLKRIPAGAEYGISFLFGILATLCALARKQTRGLLIILVVMLAYVGTAFLFFTFLAWSLPFPRPLLTILATSVGVVLLKHQGVRRSLTNLEKEKESIAAQLREKEAHLKRLEQERHESQQHTADRRTALADEIRKYRQEIRRLSAEVSDLHVYQEKPNEGTGIPLVFEGMVYRSGSSVEEIIEFIKKIAGNDAAVLILGESGTGKELVARAIHRLGERKEKAFIAVNCGALSETLLESELFGHEKGAFTGAVREKPGRFELADGGTIFLDEIAETSEAFQVKLLRVLQEGEIERVGGTMTKKVDVRVIAATNVDLKKAVAGKKFREDLYYRLNVFTIQLPPLRERLDDLPLLVEHLMNLEQRGMRVSSNVMEILFQHDWNGNVRELQGVLKRAVILARYERRDIVRMKDLPEDLLSNIQRTMDIEEQILRALREKRFSRSAISDTGDELGGLNRGTVAEYFRGFCFKIFYEQHYDLEATLDRIAQTDDPDVQEKVRKKVLEYLSNAVEPIDRKKPYEQNQPAAGAKFKNLPQRYHYFLEEILSSYHRETWNLDRE